MSRLICTVCGGDSVDIHDYRLDPTGQRVTEYRCRACGGRAEFEDQMSFEDEDRHA